VPTLLENGYPGFEPLGWVGLFVAAGTPKPIVDAISKETMRVMKLPEVRARLYEQTLMPVGSTAAEFERTLKEDSDLWGKIARGAGIKPQ